MNNIVLKDILEIRNDTQKSFDLENNQLFNETIGELSRPVFTKYYCLARINNEFKGALFESLALYVKAIDILISAFYLVRQRAFVESLALLRMSIETCCTAIHIYEDSITYEKYLNQNYHSSKSIKNANKHIPKISELWGTLSNFAVHINTVAHGSKKDVLDKQTVINSIEVELERRKGEKNQDSKFLYLVCLVANINLKTSELLFYERTSDNNEYLKLKGFDCIKVGVSTDHLINKYFELFTKTNT